MCIDQATAIHEKVRTQSKIVRHYKNNQNRCSVKEKKNKAFKNSHVSSKFRYVRQYLTCKTFRDFFGKCFVI